MPASVHVPGDVVGEHADEHVGGDPVFEPVADGADQQVGVQAAEDPLDVFQGLVGLHRGAGAEHAGGQAGADHVDAVQGRFAGDLLLVAAPGQPVAGDVHSEVLGDLL